MALVDFSHSTGDLCRTAGAMAAMMNSRLVLLHVAMPFTIGLDTEERNHHRRITLAKVFRCRHRELKKLEKELCEQGIDACAMMVRGRSLYSNPIRKIVEMMNRLSPEMILAAPHRRGRLLELFTNSVTRSLARMARCPVVLVPDIG